MYTCKRCFTTFDSAYIRLSVQNGIAISLPLLKEILGGLSKEKKKDEIKLEKTNFALMKIKNIYRNYLVCSTS